MSWSDGYDDYLVQRGNGDLEDSEDSEDSQSSQETDSSQEVTEHLNPWSHILDEAKNATRPSSMLWSMSTKGTEIRKMWLTLKRRTLSFLSTEKN